MLRRSRVARALIVAAAMLAGASARAQQPGETQGRSVEDRLRDVEAANAALRDQMRALQQKVEPPAPAPPVEPSSAEPFAWGDFTWMNGASRQTQRTIDTKYFTPQFDVDLNYTYSFNQP